MTAIRITLSIIALFFLFLILRTNMGDHRSPNVINWDVYGYYVPLQGALIYHDVNHFAFAEKQLQQYKFSSSLYQLQELPNGNRIPVYTIGIAITQLPFFLSAEIVTSLSGNYARDGMSPPFQWAMLIS